MLLSHHTSIVAPGGAKRAVLGQKGGNATPSAASCKTQTSTDGELSKPLQSEAAAIAKAFGFDSLTQEKHQSVAHNNEYVSLNGAYSLVGEGLNIDENAPSTSLPEALTKDSAIALTTSNSDSESGAEILSLDELVVNVASIPETLVIEVRLPEPAALPPVISMNPIDCVRELAAIFCMREAETAAALEACDGTSGSGPSGFVSPFAGKTSSLSVQGSLEVCSRGAISFASISDSQLDAVEAEDGNASASPSRVCSVALDSIGLDATCVAGDGSFSADQWLAGRRVMAIRAAAGRACGAPATMLASDVAAAVSHAVRLVLSLPSGVHARTLSYSVPRTSFSVPAGVPSVGAPACKDAVAALRGVLAAMPAGAAAAAPTVDLPTSFASFTGEKVTPTIPLLTAHVKPWVHAGLPPAASEARVQALIDRVYDLTGYHATPPVAPLAQTRLGSAHANVLAQAGCSIPYNSVSATASFGAGLVSPTFKQYFASNSTAVFSPPPRARAPASAYGAITPVAVRSSGRSGVGRERAVNLSSSGPAGLSFSVTSRSLFHSPTLPAGPHSAVKRGSSKQGQFEGFTASFGPLLSPKLVEEAPLGALTPPRSSQRVLARYVSTRDQSRAGADPASLDREYHARILGHMQAELTAMSEQRRAEEGHMLAATRVKPAKDPRTGGYMYISHSTGARVDAHAYEDVYLKEVHYASEYISEQAALLWKAEAEEEEARRADLAEFDSAGLAVERARARRIQEARLSWWAQDVEEGFVADASVRLGAGLGARAAQCAEPKEVALVPVSGSSLSVGSLLQRVVLSWSRDIQDARVEAVVRSVEAAEAEARAKTRAAEEAMPMQPPPASFCTEALVMEEKVAVQPSPFHSVIPEQDLAAFVQTALPALIAPVHAFLASRGNSAPLPADDAASMQLQAALAAAIATYVQATGGTIQVESVKQQVVPSTEAPFASSYASGLPVPFSSFSLDEEGFTALSLTVSSAGGAAVDLEADSVEGCGCGYDQFALMPLSSSGVLQDALQSFTAEASASPSLLSGIVLQVLPRSGAASATDVGSVFPATRLFNGAEASSVSSCDDETDFTVQSGEVHCTRAPVSLNDAVVVTEEDEEEDEEGYYQLAGGAEEDSAEFIQPLIAPLSHVPCTVRIDSSLASDRGRAPSPTTLPDDDTHGASDGNEPALVLALPLPAPLPMEAEDGFLVQGHSHSRQEEAPLSPIRPATNGTRAGMGQCINSRAPTPSRSIAPSMLRVFSPQTQVQVPSQEGSTGTTTTRLPFVALPSPGLAARVRAASAALSTTLPVLNNMSCWTSADRSTRSQLDAHANAQAQLALPPLQLFSSPITAPRTVNSDAGALESSFTSRAAEALRLFDKACTSTPVCELRQGLGHGALAGAEYMIGGEGSGVVGVTRSTTNASSGADSVLDAKALLKASAGVTGSAPAIPTAVDAVAVANTAAAYQTVQVPSPRAVRPPPRPMPSEEGVPACGAGSMSPVQAGTAATFLGVRPTLASGLLPMVSPVRLAPLPPKPTM